MREILHSVGIDIGTTTSQVIFSRITLENTASSSSVPKIKIAAREVIYASPVHFTPLLDHDRINADALRALVEKEYAAAGIKPSDISAGAVIITGETAKKENAESVLNGLAGLAGEFVVTAAGSDLEAVLAGRGAGAEALSSVLGGVVANLDIGGGTTNIALFKNGGVLDTACLDIGGRHIQIDGAAGLVKSVTPQYRRLIKSMGLDIEEGRPANLAALRKLTRRSVELMAEILRVVPPSRELSFFITNNDFTHETALGGKPDGLVFSGGVASALLELEKNPPLNEAELFRHGDIGVLMAMSLRESALYSGLKVHPARETIRATVVGVGVHVMELSGSTVFYSDAARLPLKNIPILKVPPDAETAGGTVLAQTIRSRLPWHQHGAARKLVGIAVSGKPGASYAEVTALADALAEGCRDLASSEGLAVVLVENDIAKALGNALHDRLGKAADIYCLDAVTVDNGDFIDIGKPAAGGRVLPVVVKSLLFGA